MLESIELVVDWLRCLAGFQGDSVRLLGSAVVLVELFDWARAQRAGLHGGVREVSLW